MTAPTLEYINTQLTNAGINYQLGEWEGDIVDPYFTGEYIESPLNVEDGSQETNFILNGFSRGSWSDLETAKTTIEKLFTFNSAILDDGSGVDISYSGSSPIPTGDAEFKRIQINLTIQEWRIF